MKEIVNLTSYITASKGSIVEGSHGWAYYRGVSHSKIPLSRLISKQECIHTGPASFGIQASLQQSFKHLASGALDQPLNGGA